MTASYPRLSRAFCWPEFIPKQAARPFRHLNSNWIVGVEYRHYILDAKTISVTSTDGTFVEQIDFKPKADTVMARLSYKFNWGAPLVAKY